METGKNGKVVSAMNPFKLQDKNTNFLAEMIAGTTTFITMSYLLVQCPKLLAESGVSEASAYLAVCIAAAAGCLAVGLLANQPFVLAPSLGMTVFFTSTLIVQMKYTYSQALALTLIGSLLYLVLTLTGGEKLIYGAIPMGVRRGVSTGLGIYIALIGFKNAGIITYASGGLWRLVDFSEPSKQLFTSVVMLSGILAAVFLQKTRVPFPNLFGILFSGVVYYILGMRHGYADLTDLSPDLGSVNGSQIASWASECLFKNCTTGLSGLFLGIRFDLKTFLSLFFVIVICALFNAAETSGVVYTTARSAGTLDDGGNFGELQKVSFANALSSIAASCFGAPMVTVTPESGAGTSVGGKTGLTAVTAGIFFLLAALFTPLVNVVPPVVTACALVLLGVSMMAAAKDIDFGESTEAIPALLAVMTITFTSSIIDGIAIGLIAHIALIAVSLKFQSLKIMELILCALFCIAYFRL